MLAEELNLPHVTLVMGTELLDDARKVRDKEESVQVKDIAKLVAENLVVAGNGEM
ncbi:unnamed protein product [marine sediment metagenome]|uniref:Uncharacterized protein n=1 Tax=marine sediment metagenome TaxID=412755 RepID=X1TQU3_9ZZZZ